MNNPGYGFVQNEKLSDCDTFRVEELVGPVIYRQPSLGSRAAEVDVVIVKAPSDPRGQFNNSLARKRALIWQNHERNSMIAALAKGIQRGWSSKLVQQGLLNQQQADAIFRHRYPTTAILVENSEHAEHLRRCLPDWNLCQGLDALSCIPGVSGRQITTMVYAQEYGIHADVLIRADGGLEWPLTSQRYPCVQHSADRAVVVDFAVLGDKRNRRIRQRQRKAYEVRGWRVIS